MSSSGISQVRRETILLNEQLKNLRDKYKNEFDRLELGHKQALSNEKINQKSNLETLKLESNKKILDELERKEQVLNDMASSVAQTKLTTEKQKKQIVSQQDEDAENMRLRHSLVQDQRELDHTLEMQTINDEANREMNRIRRDMEQKQHSYIEKEEAKRRVSLNDEKNKLEVQKDLYDKVFESGENKFSKALTNQRDRHKKTVIDQEIKNQKEILVKGKIYDEKLQKLDDLGQKKVQNKEVVFEEKYATQHARHEDTFKNLEKKKLKIIEDLKKEILNTHKLNLAKSSDPFYSIGKLDSNLIEMKDHYILEVPAPEHAVKDISLAGDKRTLSIMMNRRYNEELINDDGTSEKISKVETFSQKMPVEKIINPNSVSKSYENGKVIFKINFA
jgi:hypothetical protein